MQSRHTVAIVTGGASGIGRGIGLRLARDGADVVLFDLDLEGAIEVVERIEALGRRALALRVDVADREQVGAAVSQARRQLGAPNILVNNAGIGGQAALVDMSYEQWDRMIAVHLTGAFNCTKAVVHDLIEQGWGRIVNVSSVAGLSGGPHLSHYSAAKAGMLGLTKALARELAGAGVTVNAIAPGLIDTPILRGPDMSEQQTQGLIDAVVSRTPVGRIGTPDDIAAACAFLVSDEAGFTTGQVLSPNGGFHV